MKIENNFSDVLTEKSLLHPNKVYCHKINGREITFLELEQYVNRCCRLYEEIGVVSNDVVTISIPNSISFIIFYIAGIRSGIKVNPCPSTLSEHELVKNINFVESKLLITQKLIDTDTIPVNCSYLKFNDDDDFLLQLETYKDDKYEREICSDDIACIYYSSGTTGNTKSVLYSHKNMLSLTKSIVNDFQFLLDEHKTMNQLALAYILSHKEVSTCIPGVKTAEQLKSNISSSEIKLTLDELNEIRDIQQKW